MIRYNTRFLARSYAKGHGELRVWREIRPPSGDARYPILVTHITITYDLLLQFPVAATLALGPSIGGEPLTRTWGTPSNGNKHRFLTLGRESSSLEEALEQSREIELDAVTAVENALELGTHLDWVGSVNLEELFKA